MLKNKRNTGASCSSIYMDMMKLLKVSYAICSNLWISEQLDGIMPVFADDIISLGMNN